MPLKRILCLWLSISKHTVKRLLHYDNRNCLRIRQIEAFTTFLEAANRKSRDVIETSPGWNRYWRELCPDYRSVGFPAGRPPG